MTDCVYEIQSVPEDAAAVLISWSDWEFAAKVYGKRPK